MAARSDRCRFRPTRLKWLPASVENAISGLASTSNLPNNQSSPTSTTTSYTYTAAGSSTSFGDVTQAVQGSTTLKSAYQGDGTTTCSAQPGELCTTTNGKTGVTSYGYNTSGDLTSISPPAPLVASSFTPDALGR